MAAWRISFLLSPETFRIQDAPLRPLLVKELREILSGRALWTMLLLMCPLIGYSFFQAVSLYGEASTAGLQSPVLASSLSPLDGVLVPTLGAFYVAVTLLFPFVAIRVLGQEKESGALRLLVQLPYRSPTLITAKLAAVLAAWVLSSIPAISALVIWGLLGGHLSAPETLNLLFGHLLYGLLVGAIALVCGISIGKRGDCRDRYTRLHDRFMGAGFHGGRSTRASRMDCPPVVHPSAAYVRARSVVGWSSRRYRRGGVRFRRAGDRLAAAGSSSPQQDHSLDRVRFCSGLALGLATQIKLTFDVTEDRRNSFPASRPAPARIFGAALGRDGASCAGGSALRRPAAQRAGEAGARHAERIDPAGGRAAKSRNQCRRRSLRRGRIHLWRSIGRQPLDQSARNPPDAVRPRRSQSPGTCPGKRLSGLSAGCQRTGRSSLVFRRTSALYRPRLVVESTFTQTNRSTIMKEAQP